MFIIFVQKIYNISLATIITGPSAYWGLLCAYLLFFAAAVPRGRVCHIGGVLFGLLQILVQLLLGHHARADVLLHILQALLVGVIHIGGILLVDALQILPQPLQGEGHLTMGCC